MLDKRRVEKTLQKYPNATKYEAQHGINSKASQIYREKLKKEKMLPKIHSPYERIKGKKPTIAEEAQFCSTGENEIREIRYRCKNILLSVKDLQGLDYIDRITLKAVLFKNLPELKKKIRAGHFNKDGTIRKG